MKNNKSKMASVSEKELHVKLPKLVLNPEEKEQTPHGALWRLQLFTYWLADAIQSRSLEPDSSRFYAFFEGNRRHELIYTSVFEPEIAGRSSFENESGYYHLMSRVAMQACRLRSIVEKNSLDLEDVLQIERTAIKMDETFYRLLSKGKPINRQMFEDLIKFKSIVDNLTFSSNAVTAP